MRSKTVRRRHARVVEIGSPEQYAAISAVFEQASERVRVQHKEIDDLQGVGNHPADVDAAVDIALEIIERLPELPAAGNDLASVRKLFDLIDAKLFLTFRPKRLKKRIVNKVARGVVTFGNVAPPIEIYEGLTARKKVNSPAAISVAGLGECQPPSPPPNT